MNNNSNYKPMRSGNGAISFLVDKRVLKVTLILLFVTITTILLSASKGEINIPINEVFRTLIGQGQPIYNLTLLSLRLPRIITALLVGASLAVSGAILQGIIRNPLTSPGIIGVTGGASAAVVGFISIFTSKDLSNSLSVSINWLPVVAFLGAAIVMFLVYFLAWKKGISPIRLVLIGIGVSAAMKALTTMMIVLSPIYLASQAMLWLTGSIYAADWNDVLLILPWTVILLPLAFVYARDINIQSLGDDIASSVGSSVEKNRFILLLIAVGLAGAGVSVAGGIGFVGLVAPHMGRKLVGPNFEGLLPVSALLGGLILLLADFIARMAFAPLDIPAGIFTAIVGAPYFIYLLYQNSK